MALTTRSVAVKRGFDLIVACVGLAVLSPVLGVIAITVLVRFGRPILFRQERPGLGGRLFQILKFRTMSDGRDNSGNLLADAQRLSGFGAFLRRTSFDELPELWNVLWGEMSIVGPRPLLPEYLPHYNVRQARRHEMRPGLTGWAQVNGRNELSWGEKFELDVWYVDNWSFELDLRILRKTLGYVVHGRGISHPGEATMKPFQGNSAE
jgi:sugar transferase EpsL